MNKINSIYLIFPIVSLFISIYIFKIKVNKKIKRIINILSIVFLIFFLGISEVGPDYKNYKDIYNQIKAGISLKYIHSEIGYKKLNQIFINQEISYEIFKSFYLSSLLLILGVYINKLTINLSYSYFLLYSFYIIYLCSAYRQFCIMTFLIGGFYYYLKKQVNKSIILMFCSMSIHFSGIFPFLYFVFLKLKKTKIKYKYKYKKLLYGIILSLFFRILFFKFTGLINSIFVALGLIHYILERPILIGLGLLSRIFISILMILNIKEINKNKIMRVMFLFYYIGTIIYLLVPYELIIGRLTNCSKILEIFILPYIIKSQKKIRNKVILFIIISMIGIVILLNQLINQGGYYPYKNILF